MTVINVADRFGKKMPPPVSDDDMWLALVLQTANRCASPRDYVKGHRDHLRHMADLLDAYLEDGAA